MTNPTLITLGVAAVAAAILWLTREPPTVEPIAHAPALVTSPASTEGPDAASRRVNAADPRTPEPLLPTEEESRQTSGVIAPSQEHRQMVALAVRAGALPDDQLRLATASDWDALLALWDAASNDVRTASTARRNIGHRMAKQRLADGRYERHEALESDRLPDGGFRAGPWMAMHHPDELISTRSVYRPGGGQFFDVVRFGPGDALELDQATVQWRMAESLRRDAIARFVADHGRRLPANSK
jgi:hypothetical protein